MKSSKNNNNTVDLSYVAEEIAKKMWDFMKEEMVKSNVPAAEEGKMAIAATAVLSSHIIAFAIERTGGGYGEKEFYHDISIFLEKLDR